VDFLETLLQAHTHGNYVEEQIRKLDDEFIDYEVNQRIVLST